MKPVFNGKLTDHRYHLAILVVQRHGLWAVTVINLNISTLL